MSRGLVVKLPVHASESVLSRPLVMLYTLSCLPLRVFLTLLMTSISFTATVDSALEPL